MSHVQCPQAIPPSLHRLQADGAVTVSSCSRARALFLMTMAKDKSEKVDPARLAVWTSIGVNYSTYQPTHKQILERYLLKFQQEQQG